MANTYKTSSATDTGSLNYHINEYALVRGLTRLNSDLVVTKLITNYSAQAKAQGSRYAQNVRVPITGTVTATDKTPGTAVTYAAVTSTKADIPINTHKTWDALFEDYGTLFSQSTLLGDYLADASSAIAEEIENDVIALYASAGTQIGTAEGGLTETVLKTARKNARENKFRMSQPMYLVYGTEGEYDLLGVDRHTLANQSGGTDALTRASFGTIYGMDLYTSNLMPAVTGSPNAEHCMLFQREAMGIAFVDMNTASVPETYTGAVNMQTMSMPDDSGAPIYSLRLIHGYDQKERGTALTVDTIYGVGVVRSALLIDVLV